MTQTMKQIARKAFKDGAGFTLTELMVTVALSSVVIYGMTGVLRSGQFQANTVGTQAQIQESARLGLMRMLEEIRESAPTRMTLNPDSLVFQIPQAFQANGDIVWSGNITYSLGGLNGTQLIRTAADGTVTVLANDVSGIVFSVDDPADPTLVTVRLDAARQTVQGRTYDESLTGEAQLRNEE